MSLKTKAVHGFSWSLFEGIFSQGTIFIVGIVLARLLEPKDFGLIGIITAFLSISAYLVEGGLKKALIRKIDVTETDYSTVFISNLLMGLLLYLLLFLSAGPIARFYEESSLELLFKAVGIILIIDSLAIVQQAKLIRKLDFKTQGIIAISSTFTSGILAIILAYQGFGIWSLVVFSVVRPLLNTTLYWIKGNWKPNWKFSIASFKDLFNFGYKLLLADLLNTLYSNVYYLLIGKFFSTQSLGYYTRAQQFQTPVSSNIALGIYRISFPIMSSIQNDIERLKSIFTKFLRFSAFLNFNAMLVVAAMAKPIILILIGPKWETSIYYLQLLCIPGMIYPLQILNLSVLIVKGYSNLSLRLEIIKKIILFPLVVITAFFSIEVMLYGLILFSIIELFINSYYNKKIIDMGIMAQLKQVFPFLCMSLINFLIMFSLTMIKELNLYLLVALQVILGLGSFILINEYLKLEEYKEIKTKVNSLLIQKIKRFIQKTK